MKYAIEVILTFMAGYFLIVFTMKGFTIGVLLASMLFITQLCLLSNYWRDEV